MHSYKVGDKVHYIPFEGCLPQLIENGIVKSVPHRHAVFVVYNCAGEWDRYQDYTAALTSVDDLEPGWKNKVNTKEPDVKCIYCCNYNGVTHE